MINDNLLNELGSSPINTSANIGSLSIAISIYNIANQSLEISKKTYNLLESSSINQALYMKELFGKMDSIISLLKDVKENTKRS